MSMTDLWRYEFYDVTSKIDDSLSSSKMSGSPRKTVCGLSKIHTIIDFNKFDES